MNLKNYLIKLLLDEKEIVEELIMVDNKVMFSNLTYKDLYNIVEKCKIDFEDILSFNYDFILDGDINTIVYVLINYSTCVRYLHVNSNYVGITSWLITKINQYYNDININTCISLDINKGYKDFSQDEVLVLCGHSYFINGIKDLFDNKKFIIIEMGDKRA